jgi:heptosyltransferase-3
MRQALVLPARGIGDGLLMMIASQALHQAGYRVTTVHPSLFELQDWFPHQTFAREIPSLPAEWDLIIAENDNSPAIQKLRSERKNVSIFYPTYLASKHGPLSPLDQTFDPTKPFASNVASCISKLLKRESSSKNNGIRIPPLLSHRHFKERILLHPTSSDPKKNWPKEKYLELAQKLKSAGLSPVFIVSPAEKSAWLEVERAGFSLPDFTTLSALAHFTYESGALIGNDSLMGHLASNLGLPTLILADDPKRMLLWRPDWAPTTVLTPPSWIPNPKWLRLRKSQWQKFISVKQTLINIINILKIDLDHLTKVK